METVEVVITIPKEYKDYIKYSVGIIPDKIIQYLFNALDNGTVLPKGHGRLIDANVLWDAYQDLGQDFYEAFDFAEANAVIEADEDNT